MSTNAIDLQPLGSDRSHAVKWPRGLWTCILNDQPAFRSKPASSLISRFLTHPKRTLLKLCHLEGTFGNLTLPESSERPLVFLAGGIGVTPFRSMLVQTATHNLSQRLVLFYSNPRLEDAPLLHELQDLQRKISSYSFVGTVTQLEKSNCPWTGETEYLDHAMLTRHLEEIESPVLYCWPTGYGPSHSNDA